MDKNINYMPKDCNHCCNYKTCMTYYGSPICLKSDKRPLTVEDQNKDRNE